MLDYGDGRSKDRRVAARPSLVCRRQGDQGGACSIFSAGCGDAYRVAAGDLVFNLRAMSLDAAAEKPMSELLMLYRFAAEILPRKNR